MYVALPGCGLSYTRICRSGLVSENSAVSRDVMICSCSHADHFQNKFTCLKL